MIQVSRDSGRLFGDIFGGLIAARFRREPLHRTPFARWCAFMHFESDRSARDAGMVQRTAFGNIAKYAESLAGGQPCPVECDWRTEAHWLAMPTRGE